MKIQSKDNRIKEITYLFFPQMSLSSAAWPSKWSTLDHHILITAQVIQRNHSSHECGNSRGNILVCREHCHFSLTPMFIYPRARGSGRLLPNLRWHRKSRAPCGPALPGSPWCSHRGQSTCTPSISPSAIALPPTQLLRTQLEAIALASSKACRVADGEVFCYPSRLINSLCLQQLSTRTNKALRSSTAAPCF